MDAAVMPLPREETTPPVTKTYFDIDDLQGGFSNLTGEGDRLNLYLRFRLQDDHPGLVVGPRRFLHRELRLGLRRRNPHLLEEAVDRVQLELQAWDRVMHRHDVARLELANHLRGLRRGHRGPAPDRHQPPGGRRPGRLKEPCPSQVTSNGPPLRPHIRSGALTPIRSSAVFKV